ncbi:MAG: aldehyde ferredoxin oxidoreductase C-terminal domain-containing protein [Thermodesulfobacteriota bacterium]
MNFIRVHMTNGRITIESFPQNKFVGGRATIDYLMTEDVSPTVHPLSEGNVLIIASGLLAGTSAPSSGRLSIGGKSPLTGGIKEANVGGTAGHKLGRLGVQAIVAEGKAKDWQILKLDAKGAALEAAGDIIGLDNYAACERLRQRYGNRIGIIITGPAGEKKYANSTIAVTDVEGRPCRHAARGGVGAIMGAKSLKAIVIDDTSTSLRKAVDPEAFSAAVKTAIETINSGPYGELMHKMGTPGMIDIDNARGSLPTYNHRRGAFEKVQNINANRLIELNSVRGGSTGHACMPGCAVQCSNIFHDAEGKYVTASLEYETLAMLGSNLGIDDLDAIARMDRRCDGLGIDTIETGCTIGILNDIGLFDFGDIARAEALIEEIGQGSPMGRILGSGVEIAAKVFGIDRVPAVKGQGIPAHAARSMKGWGVTYATSPQGADHTTGSVVMDVLSPFGQVERSRTSQIINTAFDITGLCHLTFLFKNPETIMPMINAFYGVSLTLGDFMEIGKEMLRQERAFNIKAGIGPSADRLPEWMRTESLPPTNAVFDVPQEEIDNLFDF